MFAEERSQLSLDNALLSDSNQKLSSDLAQLQDDHETALSQLEDLSRQLLEYEQKIQVPYIHSLFLSNLIASAHFR